MKCPDCNGKGWNNDLATLLEQMCRNCFGTGQVRRCDRCTATGVVPHWSTTVPVLCEDCSGRGWLPL